MKQLILLFSFMSIVGYSNAQLTKVAVKVDSIPFSDTTELLRIVTQTLKPESGIHFRLNMTDLFTDDMRGVHYVIDFYIGGYKVEFARLKAHTVGEKLTFITGVYPKHAAYQEPAVSEETAFDAAKAASQSQDYVWLEGNQAFHDNHFKDNSPFLPVPKGELVYLPLTAEFGGPIMELCYRFDFLTIEPLERYYQYVSSVTGQFIYRVQTSCSFNGTVDTKYSGTRTVTTSQVPSPTRYQLQQLTGDGRCYIRAQYDGAACTDFDNNWTAAEYDNSTTKNATTDMYWAQETFYDYFKLKHNRSGLDNTNTAGMLGTYYPEQLDKAAWLGGFAAFYKGNTIFRPMTSVDIVAHEFAHAMGDYTAHLNYQGIPGAIDESLSDIWGACVEHFAETTFPDLNKDEWLSGEEIVLSGAAYRSLADPKAFGQPDTYQGEYWADPTDLLNDNGGVHYNSGIMNYWFYLLSEGGSGVNDNLDSYLVQGISMARAAKIVYRAETVYFDQTTSFADARDYTVYAARDLYGICSPEVEAVIRAWHAVGVGLSIEEANTLNIAENVLANQSDYQYVYHTMTATNTINNLAIADYESSVEIFLQPGFYASQGSDVDIKITSCNTSFGIQKLEEIETVNEVEDSENSEEIEFVLYPNPTMSEVTIALKKELDGQNILMMNNVGEMVMSDVLLSKNHTFDTSWLSPGVYFVTLCSGEKKSVQKLVKL
jgi:bacillolysin